MLDEIIETVRLNLEAAHLQLCRIAVLTSDQTRTWFIKLLYDAMEKEELTVALNRLHERYSHQGKKPKETMAMAIRHWQKRLRETQSIAKAFEGWFPLADLALLETTIDALGTRAAFGLLLEGREQRSSLAMKSLKGLLNGLVVFCPAVLGYVIAQTNDGFTRMVADFGEASGFKAIFDGFAIFWIPGLLFCVLFAAGIAASFRYLQGSSRKWLNENVGIYRAYVSIKASLVLSLYGTMLINKAIESDAFEKVSDILTRNNPWLASVLGRAKQLIHKQNIGEAFIALDAGFPSKEHQLDLVFYAPQEGFPEKILEIADIAHQEAWRQLRPTIWTLNWTMVVVGIWLILEIGMFIVGMDPSTQNLQI